MAAGATAAASGTAAETKELEQRCISGSHSAPCTLIVSGERLNNVEIIIVEIKVGSI